MFSIPFVYFTFKLEEEKDLNSTGFKYLLGEHGKAISAFMFLFLGFVIAFSFWHIALPSGNQNFMAQIETYCMINRPVNFDQCVTEYGTDPINIAKTTGFLTSKQKIVNIFANNIYVLIFTLVFSLLFGAGAIFILVWNASVISTAAAIFAKSNLLRVADDMDLSHPLRCYGQNCPSWRLRLARG